MPDVSLKSVLDVGTSLNKARWVMPDVPLDVLEQAVRRSGASEIAARLLLGRGIALEDFDAFLTPWLKDHFPDPFSLKGMADMAHDVALWIKEGRSFAIFGDFDVDGATSSAVLYRFLKACGIEVRVYIPDRLSEGYGPNEAAFQTLRDEGAEVLFVLDCGITSFDVIAKGRAMGMDIIVMDHHEAEDRLPEANHVINPKRRGDESGLDVLAAVGVTFLSCVGINKLLREQGFWEGRTAPDLRHFLDIVALGTVCDMVPLLGPNRLFVRHGMARLNRLENAGIAALCDVSRLDGEISVSHLGFALGPRINAGGRIHQSDLGAKLLCTDDPQEAEQIAWQLNDCNDKRKAIQLEMQRGAEAQVEDGGLDQHEVILVDDTDWHPGLSGLVAGKLKDKYGKPACVVTYTKTGEGGLEGRGSGRSISGVHLAQSFIDARNAGLLLKGGGHAMAGGFTIDPVHLDAFKAFMMDHVRAQQSGGAVAIETQVDALISPLGASVALLKELEQQVGPFGQDFQAPLFVMSHVRLHEVDIVGEQHIRLMVSDWEGGSRIKAMAFGAVGTAMGEAFLTQGKQPFHLCGQLSLNRWQGRESAELHVKDAVVA